MHFTEKCVLAGIAVLALTLLAIEVPQLSRIDEAREAMHWADWSANIWIDEHSAGNGSMCDSKPSCYEKVDSVHFYVDRVVQLRRELKPVLNPWAVNPIDDFLAEYLPAGSDAEKAPLREEAEK